MLRLLKKWFSSASHGSTAARNGTARPSPKTADTGGDTLQIADTDIDIAFSGYVLGATSSLDCKPGPFERRALRDINKLVSGGSDFSSLVPRLPAVMPRVMRALRDDESSNRQLATELARDPALVGEVIRLANSPYYRVGREINSLEGAIRRLGRTGVRQLVSRAVFKPLLNTGSGHFSRISGPLLWEQAEKTAVVCDCLARKQDADRFHAYLAGIVHNAGLRVLTTVLDRNYDDTDVPRSLTFRTRLMTRAAELAAGIAAEWAFPAEVVDALDAQSGATGPGERLSGLAGILQAGDRLAKFHMLCERGHFGETPCTHIGCRRLAETPAGNCDTCRQTPLQQPV